MLTPRAPRIAGHAADGEDEYSDDDEEEEEEEEADGWQAQVEEGDPNKRRRKPNPRYLDPPSKHVKSRGHKSHRPSMGGHKGPPSLAALDADLLASLAEAAEKHAHGGGGGGDDAGAAGGDDDEEAAGGAAGPQPQRVNLDIVREALAEHASGIATAVEAAYGAEATATIREALEAENQRLHNRIVGLLQLSSVL